MLLGFQEGALEAPQAGVGDALFQHDVITHPAATGLGGAGLASSRAASWRATQPSEAWVSSVGYKPELGRTAVTSHYYSPPYSGSGWLTVQRVSHWVLKLEQVGGEYYCDTS